MHLRSGTLAPFLDRITSDFTRSPFINPERGDEKDVIPEHSDKQRKETGVWTVRCRREEQDAVPRPDVSPATDADVI